MDVSWKVRMDGSMALSSVGLREVMQMRNPGLFLGKGSKILQNGPGADGAIHQQRRSSAQGERKNSGAFGEIWLMLKCFISL